MRWNPEQDKIKTGNGLILMHHRRHKLLRCSLALLAGLGVLAGSPQLEIPVASAQSASKQPVATKRPPLARSQTVSLNATQRLAKPYFIEFRARAAQSYGHTFAMYGQLSPQGAIVRSEVTGLHPFTESVIPWMIGHLLPVPSETGPSDGDTEDQYVTARFRVLLSADEYQKVVAIIKKLQNGSPVWHAVFYNCQAFVGDIAQLMGFNIPASSLLQPQEYIDNLRDLNIGRSDLNAFLGTPVRVEEAKTLRLRAGAR